MSAEWESFLAERPIAVLATVGADGFAHAVAVEVVVDAGSAYVWCESDSAKARNARRTSRATISAYKGAAGVMVRGGASFIQEPDAEYARVTRMFLDKYRREETYGNDLLIRIAAERVTTWG